MERPQGSLDVPFFSPQALMDSYLRGQSDNLSESFLRILRHFRDRTYPSLNPQGQRFINEFIKHFLMLFTQAEYSPGRSHLFEFVGLNATISNLVSLSTFKTTDAFLGLLGAGPSDLAKVLVLCSARNTIPLERAPLF